MDANPELELTNQEKKAVFNIYLDSGMYQEALDIYPKGAEELIADVREKGTMEVLLDLENVTSQAILFEQFVLKEEYETAKPLILEIDYQLPERQEAIVKTYMYTDDAEMGAKKAKEAGLDIKDKLVEWHTDAVNKSELTDEEKAVKIEDGKAAINKGFGE